MLVSFDVSGYYDFEPADLHPGVKITKADVKALRAKPLADGRWGIRVELTKYTHHDTAIPELAICRYLANKAIVRENLTRQDAVLYMLSRSARFHVEKRHVKGVNIHDDGPNPDLFKQILELAESSQTENPPLTETEKSEALERYTETCDLKAAIEMQHLPKSKKGA